MRLSRPILAVILFVLVLATILILAGCSQKSMEPFQDAGIANRHNGPADVYSMPDGFSNFAAKCDGPVRVYTAFKGDNNRASIAVVANHPLCAPAGSQ